LALRQKRRRLSRTAEFDRVYRHGRSTSNRYLVLYVFPREDQGSNGPFGERRGEDAGGVEPRLGVSVGKRVGGAVVRNRVKRLLREAFWSLEDVFDQSNDYVIVARADAGSLVERSGLDGLRESLRELAEKRDSDDFTGEGSGEEGSPT
jgi:ribonuclease P protein component